jgi:hypothetical protein
MTHILLQRVPWRDIGRVERKRRRPRDNVAMASEIYVLARICSWIGGVQKVWVIVERADSQEKSQVEINASGDSVG